MQNKECFYDLVTMARSSIKAANNKQQGLVRRIEISSACDMGVRV